VTGNAGRSGVVKVAKSKRKLRRSARPASAAGSGASLASSSAEHSQMLALWAAQAGLDKKARDVEIIDVTGKVDYADYLVLMTGQSDRHVAAIAASVDELLRQHQSPPISIEGLSAANWVLIDLVDVVVHVFLESSRALYDLDGLWMDAGRLPLPESASGST